MNLPRHVFVALPLLLPLGLPACTSQTIDNFENPPPGPPAACTMSSLVTGCTGGSQGYVCAGDRPDDGDTNLVCGDGVPGAAGSAIYCCAPYGQYWSDCTVDTGVPGCVGSAFGFTCTGPEMPGDADASLMCSAGTPNGSDTAYCCNSAVVSLTCAYDATVGQACSSTQQCPSADCIGGVCGGIAPCGSPSIGYTCTGTDSPGNSAPSLACSIGTEGAGVTSRCCIPFAQSSDACQEDDAVTGCAPGSYGFSCAGATAPVDLNPALQCQALAGGLFCCNLAPG